MMHILIVHGPNLNLLGERSTQIYGTLSLDEINRKIKDFANEKGVEVRIFQSNSEGKLIDIIQENRKWCRGIVINPGAYTHYSYAIRDAIEAVGHPAVEVHLSDIHSREPFRSRSVIADVCLTQISGQGYRSYLSGVEFLLNLKYRHEMPPWVS